MDTRAIAMDQVRIDGGTQPRAEISESTVRNYAFDMDGGKVFPAVDVFFDGVAYWLADGFHRYLAARSLRHLAITASVHPGTRRDAVLFSVAANSGHGLQRTNADKQKAVMTLLRDDEWSSWSNAEIAKRCGVDSSTVDKWRIRSLPDSGSEKSIAKTYTTKHGTEATMNVDRIGRSSPKTNPDRSKAASVKRIEEMRTMAAEGYTTRQIAAKLEVSEEGCHKILRREGVDVPADKAVGKSKRHDSDRIVEHMVMDAENLTADTNLIEFSGLDRERLGGWIDSLIASKKALDLFIRRLIKEQRKYGKAA